MMKEQSGARGFISQGLLQTSTKTGGLLENEIGECGNQAPMDKSAGSVYVLKPMYNLYMIIYSIYFFLFSSIVYFQYEGAKV